MLEERRKERKKKQTNQKHMGKSIRVCEKWSERLAFPHWSSKGYFTPKKLVSIACAWHNLGESGGISAGEFTRYLFFALGLGWALGTIDACLM